MGCHEGGSEAPRLRYPPLELDYWLWAAFATRKAEGIEEARKIMVLGKQHHPQEASVDYNLACYAAQLGYFDKAKECLKEALDRPADPKHVALQDTDLEPLCSRMGL